MSHIQCLGVGGHCDSGFVRNCGNVTPVFSPLRTTKGPATIMWSRILVRIKETLITDQGWLKS